MSILQKPLVTEKVAALNEKGVFGFIVDKKANKVQIKREVERVYGVTVEKVNTMITPGKVKNRFSKNQVITGKTKSIKKAIVTLREGEVIDFYSNI